MTQLSATGRFSDYASEYEKYRPQYPAAIIPWLQGITGLQPGAPVADIGSGTGLFTRLLLNSGCAVQSIEPNDEMRLLAEKQLRDNPLFRSVDGTAEATTLPDHSVALITSAQAFHWFNLEATGREFRRILQPGGWCLLVWNILRRHTPFLQGYQALKDRYANDLRHTHRANRDAIQSFFAPATLVTHELYHSQPLTLPELHGYIRSFSTIPLPLPAAMIRELDDLFMNYQQDGMVTMEYETKLYLAQL